MYSSKYKETRNTVAGGDGSGVRNLGLRLRPGYGDKGQWSCGEMVYEREQSGLPVDTATATAGHRSAER